MSQAGMEPNTTMLMAFVDSIVYFFGAMIPVFMVERVGRRNIMLWDLALQVITLVCAGDCQKANTDGIKAAGSAAVAFAMIYNFSFGASWLNMS